MRQRGLVWSLMLGVLCAWVGAGPAQAQSKTTGADKAAAETLFQEGRRLLEQDKDLAKACSKLEESQRLDPAVGTLLWLGDCYTRQGRTASAWATFHTAASAAKHAGQPKREKMALQEAAALEAALSRLTIQVPTLADVQGLKVAKDGVELARPSWGSAIPVDPGEHRIEVSAPGKLPWSKRVSVGSNGAVETVSVPVLEDAAPQVAPQLVTIPSPAPVQSPDQGSPGATQRWMGVGVFGLGLVGFGVGAKYGSDAKSKQDQARDLCPDYPLCNPEGSAVNREAKSAGNVATAAFIAGGVLAAGGVVLFLTAPSGNPAASKSSPRVQLLPAVGPLWSGLAAQGRW